MTIEIEDRDITRPRLGLYIWSLTAIWAIIIAGLLIWEIAQIRKNSRDLATNEARANFKKDQAFRYWATRHGGVYVPITESTPPNPYLSHITERDIQTPSGRELTLMNPAYMVRQLNEDFGEMFGVRGHITSLKPLRPENAPDTWERKALKQFEDGVKEAYEFTEINGEPFLRLMQPMITKKGCLKCHRHRGYREGDIRGGVGVSVPMAPYLARERKAIPQHTIPFGIIWLLGLTGIFFGGRRLVHHDDMQRKVGEALRESEVQLRLVVEKSPIPMVITDKEGNTEHFNGKFIKLFGWTTDDVRTPDEWWKAAYPDEKYRELVCSSWEAAIEKANINKTEIEPQQWQLTCKNGELRDVEFRMVPLSADRSVIAMNDITERKKAEDQLRQRLDELERYSRATVQREFRVRDLQEENEKLEARIEELEKR